MFERLSSRSGALARHRTGPLVAERLAYLEHLAEHGMAARSLREAACYLLTVADYLRLAERPGEIISQKEIDRQASRWAKRRATPANRRAGRTSSQVFRWRATDWLRFLGRLEQPSLPVSPFAEKIKNFADFMQHERGLSPATIRNRCWLIPRILDRLGCAESLREITATQIDDAFVEMLGQGGYARGTIQRWAGELRTFFRYAETRGWCRKGLAGTIQGPRIFDQESLPMGPSWDDVRKLLATTEGDQRGDIRDRAILMLLTIYGLRAAEVTHLRLEDFEWERELLTVTCSKSRRTRTYPLSRQVGDAVLRYLKEVRPRSAHREVFLSLRAPIQPMLKLGLVVARRWWSLGLAVPHEGPHALRHACATRLLAQGLSLKEIGDHLGHRHPDSTRIYSKVDLIGLRQVADFDMGGLL